MEKSHSDAHAEELESLKSAEELKPAKELKAQPEYEVIPSMETNEDGPNEKVEPESNVTPSNEDGPGEKVEPESNVNPSNMTVFRRKEDGSSEEYKDSSGNANPDLKFEGIALPPANLDLIAFSSVEWICEESSDTITVAVVRRGPSRDECKVQWKTENRNVAKDLYKAQQDVITFPPGVKKIEFKVKIIENPAWTTESVLLVHLTEPTPSDHWVLGELKQSTIYILNMDPFPNGLDPSETEVTESNDINVSSAPEEVKQSLSAQFDILTYFFYHNYANNTQETRWALVYLIYPGISWIIRTYIVYYSISATGPIFTHGKRGEQEGTFVAMGIGWLLNKLLDQYIADSLGGLKLGGKVKRQIRTAIMDTTLQLNNNSQEIFPPGKIANIMNDEVDEATSKGWLGVFALYGATIKLIFNFSWVIFLCSASGFWIVMLFPIVIAIVDAIIFILTNTHQSNKTLEALEAEEGWSNFFIEAADLRNLITLCQEGLSESNKFYKKHAEFNKCDFTAATYKKRVRFVAEYTPTIIIAGIIAFAWSPDITETDDGATTVAMFVTLISAVNNFDSVVNNIFYLVFTFSDAIASVKLISALLNARTRRKDLLDAMIRRNNLVETAIREGKLTDDLDRVIVHELEYKYSPSPHVVIPKCSLFVEPSLFVAIDARRDFGKNTLMQLLAGQILPESGFILYPSHWRMRLLTPNPLLFDNTLLENIKFGNRSSPTIPEIYELCKDLGMSRILIDSIQSSSENDDNSVHVGRLGMKLASTDCILISLARAFLNDVDLLLLNSTLDALEISMKDRIVGVLHSFISHRGIEKLSSYDVPTILKKPKTIICSTRSREIAAAADYYVTFHGSPEIDSKDDKSEYFDPKIYRDEISVTINN